MERPWRQRDELFIAVSSLHRSPGAPGRSQQDVLGGRVGRIKQGEEKVTDKVATELGPTEVLEI